MNEKLFLDQLVLDFSNYIIKNDNKLQFSLLEV
jgi:hypothetical protein